MNDFQIEQTTVRDTDGRDNLDTFSTRVIVTDGRLTIRAASSAFNAKLNYIDITPVAQSGAPQGPRTLTATQASPSPAVQLNWTDDATDETGYRVERRNSDGPTSWFAVVTLGPGSTSYIDRSVNGQLYSYRVVAFNTAGSSEPSPEAKITPNLPSAGAPAAPTEFGSVGGVPAPQVLLSWKDASTNELGFRVERGEGEFPTSWRSIAILDPNSTRYLDTEATAGETTSYRVVAFNANGSSATRKTTVTLNFPARTIPAAPTNLTTAAIDIGIKLTWQDNASGETEYLVQRLNNVTGVWEHREALRANSTEYVDTTVSPGIAHSYRVQARTSLDSSAFSNVSAATVPGVASYQSIDIAANGWTGRTAVITPGVDYDIAAGGLDIWGTSDQFRFVNKPVTGDFDYSVRITSLDQVNSGSMAGLMARESLLPGARHIFSRLNAEGLRANYRSTTNGASVGTGKIPFTYPNAYVRLQRTGNVFTAYGSTSGTQWTVMTQQTLALPQTILFGMAVSARASQADIAQASFRELTDRRLTPTKPAAPSEVLATSNALPVGVKLSWKDNSTNETAFRIERRYADSDPNLGTWRTVGTVEANATRFVDTFAERVPYLYRVVAVNAAGSSTAATSAEITLKLPPPPTPDKVLAVNTPDGVKLSWFNIAGPSISVYGNTIERSTAGGPFVEIDINDDYYNTQTTIDQNVVAGTTYTYRIYAIGEGGRSPAAEPITIVADPATSVPPPVFNLTAANDAEGVRLDWENTSPDSVRLKVQRRVSGTAEWQPVFEYLQAYFQTFTDRSALAGTSYEYRVLATNKLGDSSPSNLASITTAV